MVIAKGHRVSEQERNVTDVIVIGAGAVGENVAERVVKGGLEAILVETELVGGECSYWACMPSKALLRSSAVLHAARNVDGAKQAITGEIDVAAVLKRRDSFTSNWDDSSQVEWVEEAGITLRRGYGRLVGERQVEITARDGSVECWEARQAVVLANGSTPTIPKIDGIDTVRIWGTREATSAKSIPPRLAVLGGGVAGVELAQAFARLGSKVTVIARGGLLSGFPKPAVELVAEGLEADGITLLLNTTTSSLSQSEGGPITIAVEGGEPVIVDEVLVSTGRHPATEDVGLDSVGVTSKKLTVGADGRVKDVPAGWLYAVGDVAGKALLTHQGKYEARMTGNAIVARAAGKLGDEVEAWSRYASTADEFAVPSVVFTDPELVMVGRNESQARDAGLNVRTVDLDLDVAGASLHADGYTGWAQIVVDEGKGVIVGVAFAGQDVSEMLHAATIAIVGEVPLTRLWHAVPAYPTMNEVWLRLLEAYGL
ncbi:MAG: NAD(P)/FAD-dependent oxidoreductase [Chloroflexia bacterium]|nr:NAD(P)/FAD-dependent oxidoreductase [Chloroflexia bacterium]